MHLCVLLQVRRRKPNQINRPRDCFRATKEVHVVACSSCRHTWLNQHHSPSFSPGRNGSSDTAWCGAVNQHVVRCRRE